VSRSVDVQLYDPAVLTRVAPAPVEPAVDDDDRADADRLASVVDTILGLLPARDRTVVEMVLICGLSQRDVAEELGLTRWAIRTALARSVPLLRDLCVALGISPEEDQ
jgi:RNA polymerase sigma factor (sigma-70 family)